MISFPHNLLLETFEEASRKSKSEQRRSRLESAWQLGELYPNEAQAVSILYPLLLDADGDVRGTAAEALGKIGALQSGAIPVLAAMLRVKDKTDFDARVAYALGRSGKNASAAVTNLIAAIDDLDSHASWAAVWALGEIGRPSKQVVSRLMRVIEGRDASHRLVAIWALHRIGREALAAAPLVKTCLSDPHPILRFQAARTLEEIDLTWRGTERESPLLSDLPENDFPLEEATAKSDVADGLDLGVQAIDETGEIGPAGGMHIPDLIELLHHQNPVIQGAAAEALGKVGYGSPVAVAELLAVLRQKDCPVRARVAWALGWTGNSEREVADQLVRFMEEVQGITHSQIEARWAALWSFGQIAEADEKKVEILISMLTDVESDLRFLAAECLGSIPADAKPAVPRLLQAAHDLHGTVRNRALWALSKIERIDRK